MDTGTLLEAAVGLPHSQLSGLREVGAQTASVGWMGMKLRNHKATPAQGHLGFCMSPTALNLFYKSH